MHYRYGFSKKIQNTKRKISLLVASVSLVLTSCVTLVAFVNPVSAGVEKEHHSKLLVNSSVVDFSCGGQEYLHIFDTVVNNPNGTVTGTGHYIPDPAYTWTATGTISGGILNLTILYTGLQPGYIYHLNNAIIATDGSVSGTVTDVNGNCQSFTMGAGAVVCERDDNDRNEHSRSDKKESERSRNNREKDKKHND
jgi:hypothetical protein